MRRIRIGRLPPCLGLFLASAMLVESSAPVLAQSVVMTPDSIKVRFPAVMRPDSAWPAQTLPDAFSAPDWAMWMRAGDERLQAALIFSIEVPALPAYPSLAKAVRAASLRTCKRESWLNVCAWMLPGTVGVAEGAVFFASPLPVAWRRAVWASRPVFAYLLVRGSGGLRLAFDSVRIMYGGSPAAWRTQALAEGSARTSVLGFLSGMEASGGNALAPQPPDTSCVRAARVVRAAPSVDQVPAWVGRQIPRCGDEAPAIFADRWPGKSREERVILTGWSASIHDQRMADALLAAARGESRSTEVRLASLQILITYMTYDLYFSWDGRSPLTSSTILGSQLHVSPPRQGAIPADSGTRASVYQLMGDLAEAASNDTVSEAARYLWQRLTDQVPDVAGGAAAALRLSHVCGGRYRVENAGALDLSVVLLVTGFPGGLNMRIRARSGNDVNTAGPGPVRLLFAGREVSAASPSGLSC